MEELAAALHWLEASAVAGAVRRSVFLYPAIECVHLIGIGLLFGGIVALDLRLLGFSRALTASKASRHLLPLATSGFLLTELSGAFLFIADATELIGNRAFQLKVGLMALAGLNAAAFHFGSFRTIAGWDEGHASPAAARLSALLSILIWTAVIILGRAIAYV